MRTLNVIYNKTNHFGLEKDYEFIRHSFSRAGYTIQSVDPHEPPKMADVNIHLEIPVYANIPWAAVNILLMNPEYYVPGSFNGYLHGFDAVVVRDQATYGRLSEIMGPKLKYMPFASMAAIHDQVKMGLGTEKQWLYVIGGSAKKLAAAQILLGVMTEEDQKVLIICSKPDELRVPKNCTVRSNIDGQELARLQRVHAGHIVLSEAEAFSHAAAEARASGALQFSTQLPAICEHSEDGLYTWVGEEATFNGSYFESKLEDEEVLRGAWGAAQERLKTVTVNDRRDAIKAERESAIVAVAQWSEWAKDLKGLVEQRGKRQLPPVVLPEECPPISIVTPTYNRRKLIDIAFHNLLWSDYPIEKIEWIVVEDSDDDALSSSDKIVQFGEHAKGLQLRYIPLRDRKTVGEKRNIGC